MKLAIGEVIRKYRKASGMTQEQLAEAVGVTVGAVSKWELGQSNPDIAMLPVLADLFEISVDVLLGYEQPWRNAERASADIRAFRISKRYAEGITEAEKALARYPNSFDAVYQSALLYHLAGLEQSDAALSRKALELYRRACGLIEQNTDPDVSALSIQISIGQTYDALGETELALQQLKKHNACGINNSLIGYMLARDGKHDEAIPYLSDDLLDSVLSLFRTTVGFANCCESGDCRTAMEMLDWMYGILAGLKEPGRSSYLDRAAAMLCAGSAQAAITVGDSRHAEEKLRQAFALAREFDAAPDYSGRNIRFYRSKEHAIADDFGDTAMSGLERTVAADPETAEELQRIWRKIKHEADE